MGGSGPHRGKLAQQIVVYRVEKCHCVRLHVPCHPRRVTIEGETYLAGHGVVAIQIQLFVFVAIVHEQPQVGRVVHPRPQQWGGE